MHISDRPNSSTGLDLREGFIFAFLWCAWMGTMWALFIVAGKGGR